MGFELCSLNNVESLLPSFFSYADKFCNPKPMYSPVLMVFTFIFFFLKIFFRFIRMFSIYHFLHLQKLPLVNENKMFICILLVANYKMYAVGMGITSSIIKETLAYTIFAKDYIFFFYCLNKDSKD